MIVEVRPLEDWDYFYKLAEGNCRDLTHEDMVEEVETYGHLFFDVYVDDVKWGVCFTKKACGSYSLDAFNEHKGCKAAIAAIKAGRLVCNILFTNYTNEIWTMHPITSTAVTKLAEAIGFKSMVKANGFNILRRVNEAS